MHSEAQTIARLKSMVFLIEEALRIADEGDNAMLGAKLSDCIDCLHTALAEAAKAGHAAAGTSNGTAPLPEGQASLSI